MPLSLSFTPVAGAWRDVLAAIIAYIEREHSYSEPLFSHPSFWRVDPRRKKAVNEAALDYSNTGEGEVNELHTWQTLQMEPWFNRSSIYAKLLIRDTGGNTSWVEFRFESRLHDAIFAFDDYERSLDRVAKSDLFRLMIGLAKTLGAVGFSFQRGEEDSVFGPPSMNVLREYLEEPFRNHLNGEPMLLVAGLAASQIPNDTFEYDTDKPAVKYRQAGFYLYDMLWPLGSWSRPVEDSDEEGEEEENQPS